MPLAEKYGKRNKSNAWIGLPFGATAGPLIYRKSILKSVGFDKVPEDHAGLLDLCQKLQKAGKPAGFALGNASRRRQRLCQLAAVVAQRLPAR